MCVDYITCDEMLCEDIIYHLQPNDAFFASVVLLFK